MSLIDWFKGNPPAHEREYNRASGHEWKNGSPRDIERHRRTEGGPSCPCGYHRSCICDRRRKEGEAR